VSSERDDSKIETSMTSVGGPDTGATPAPGAISRRGVLKAGTAAGLAVAGAGGYLLGSRRGRSTAASARAMAPARQNGNVLVAGWEEDAQTLDPAKTICGHEVRIVNQFGNTLWGLEGTTTEPVPMLAESWEGSEDGLTWTVTLKPDLTFQDGTPCDAEAVKWSFDRFLDADHPFYDPPYNLLSYYLGGPDLD
jgi:ABC-type transport system substrate-binding protein